MSFFHFHCTGALVIHALPNANHQYHWIGIATFNEKSAGLRTETLILGLEFMAHPICSFLTSKASTCLPECRRKLKYDSPAVIKLSGWGYVTQFLYEISHILPGD